MNKRLVIAGAVLTAALAVGFPQVKGDANNNNNAPAKNNNNKKNAAAKPAAAARPNVDAAQQKLADAKKEVESKQSLLGAAAEKIASTYHSRPEYARAREAMTAAQAKLAAASKTVLEGLKTRNPAYADALTAREKAGAKRDEVIKQDGSTTEERMEASTQVLRTGEAVSSIESAALVGNSDVVAAKKEVADAAAALSTFDHAIDDALKQDPGVQAARSAFEQAKTAQTAAEQDLKKSQGDAAAYDAALAEQRRQEELDRKQAAQKNQNKNYRAKAH